MPLAFFRAEPRQVHLDLCEKVISYLFKFKWATIRIRNEEPGLSSMPTTPRDWEESIYVKVKELTPHDVPAPLGKHATTISYHYFNFFTML